MPWARTCSACSPPFSLSGTARSPLSPRLAGESERLLRLAGTTISVIIVGESGTGKEVLARALHGLSRRRGAFVAINCAALPDGLVQTELFGHRRGAFSGALEWMQDQLEMQKILTKWNLTGYNN